jgi:beta-glucosidase
VVFAYLADPVASIAQPLQRLRGFSRVHVPVGASVPVAFELGWNELGFWNDDNAYLVETGQLVVTVTDGTDAVGLPIEITG